jgi:hypothetical protein
MINLGKRGRWIAAFALVALGCGRDRQGDDGVTTERSALTSATFVLPVFLGQNPSDVALAASSFLSVNDRGVVIEQASPNDRAMVSNTGTTDLNTIIGAHSVVGTVLSAARVFVRIDASIGGSLYQGSPLDPVSQGTFFVSGVKKKGITGFVPDGTWSRTVSWPTTTAPAPNLEPGVIPPNVMLASGVAYPSLDVKTGRTLIFNPGSYFLDGLIVEPGANLDIQAGAGPVFIFIGNGGLIFRGGFKPGQNTVGMPVPALTVMTTGNVDLEQPFTGVVIAPGGYINLKANVNTNDPKTHLGAYFARTVTLFEGNRVLHYRDPFSFQGFRPSGGPPFIGERASVTGGSIRLPLLDVTDEAHQAETVSTISRINNPGGASTFVISVGYNDTTVAATNPSLIYTDTSFTDPRDGTGRLIKKGTSLMGWSYSLDNGRTFTYGGRVAPPTGWSLIWSDPAMAKTGIDDAFVYYAQIAGVTELFEQVWDPAQQGIVSHEQNVGAALNGYCIARSIDRGISFPSVACADANAQDGSSLAVAVDQNGHHQVYVAGAKSLVLRMDGDTMTFAPKSTIAFPFNLAANQTARGHPRMRVIDGVLYFVQRVDIAGGASNLMVSRLNAATNATTWFAQATVMCNGSPCIMNEGSVGLGPGQVLEVGPGFAFDIGPDANNQAKFRIMFTSGDSPNGRRMNVAECNTDITNCRLTGWSTAGEVGDEVNPSLRASGGFFGPRWAAAWRKIDPFSPLNTMRPVAAALDVVGGVETLRQATMFPSGVPCPFDKPPHSERLGEYDLIDTFGDGRFFAAYSTTPGCRWQGTWTSDAHIGGSVFSF